MKANVSGDQRIERWATYLSALALAAYLVLSLCYVVLLPAPEVYADAALYDGLALDMLRGNGFGSTYRTPLYPAVLAGIYFVFGHSHGAVYVIQALANAASLALLMLISYRVFRTRIVGLAASGLYIIYRPFYVSSVLLLTESTAMLLVAAMVLSVLAALERRTLGRFLLAGVLAGLLSLSKAVAILYPLALVLVILASRSKGERSLGLVLAMLAGTMIVILPWTIRNYNVTRQFVPIATGGGFNFWVGNWEGYYQKTEWVWRQYPPQLAKKLAGKSEAEQDAVFVHEALRNLKSKPLKGLELAARKFTSLWFALGRGNVYMAEGIPIRLPLRKTSYLEILIMLAALVSLRLKIPDWRRKALPVVVLLVYWTAGYVATTAQSRYAVPVMPYLMMFAAYAAYRASVWVFGKLRRPADARGSYA
ncbi:MAG TPA: glycosyltransferase family 39 protein [Armatimonadota bacterium]|nr:glycosyltransferase family 39 protein [Armatimonadota bacterium]